MAPRKGGRLATLINYRLRITLNDSRTLSGRLLAFDKYMNVVLADTDEYREVKRPRKHDDDEDDVDEIKRTLGLVILRGETIVTLTVESAPPAVAQPTIQPGLGSAVPLPSGRPVPTGLPGLPGL